MNQFKTTDILIPSVMTGVLVWVFYYFGVSRIFCNVVDCGSGSWLAVYSAALSVHLLASIPGFILMYYRKVPNAAYIAILATIEVYWVSSSLGPLLLPIENGYWVWWAVKLLLFIPAFWLAHLYFSKWSVTLTQKILIAIALMLLTALASDRLMLLLIQL